MHHAASPSFDDDFARLLGSVDEALACGTPPALTHPAAEEPELVDRLMRGRRCVELLAHLRPSRRASAEHDSPAGSDTAAIGSAERLDVLLPATLGRFEVRQALGRGGFGIVYLAHDPLLKRDVALKVPRLAVLADPELKRRFAREAQAGAGLDHPNVATVYEAGEVCGVSYIASAYCPGVTLAHWLKERKDPVDWIEAALLVACLADAVQHGHSRGILHRDLKPGNVLLTQANAEQAPACRLGGAAYCPKITDFGLARRIDETGETQEGAALGTPGYMAPEQAHSAAEQCTAATDVYGLGAMLYELLVGHPSFPGSSPLEILEHVCSQEAIAPRRLRPRLPRDLETICLKCLEKKPRQRYASAGELADDLRRFLAGAPILARPASGLEKALRWCRRNAVVAALLAGIALLLLCGTTIAMGLAVWALDERQRAGEQALAAQKSARDERQARELAELGFAQAEAAVGKYLDGIEANERLRQAGFFQLRKELLRSAIPFYEDFVRQRPGDAALELRRGRAYLRLAAVRRQLGEIAQAADEYRQAQAVLRQLAVDGPSLPHRLQSQAQAHHGLGAVFYEQGDRQRAEAEHRQALAIQQQLVDRYPAEPGYRRDLARSHHQLAIALHGLGDNERALDACQSAIALRQGLAREFPAVADYQLDLSQSHNNLGAMLLRLRKHQEAAVEYDRAVELQSHLAAEFPAAAAYRQSLAQSCLNLATVLTSLRDWAGAREKFDQALRLEQQLAAEFPSVPGHRSSLAAIYYNKALTYSAQVDPDRAKDELQTAFDTRLRLVAEFPTVVDYRNGLANSAHELGKLLVKQGELDKARQMFAQAIDHQRKAVEDVPTNARYTRSLRNHYYWAANAALQQADHAAAAVSARQMATVRQAVADDPYWAARILGSCATLAANDSALSQAERLSLAHSYADEAMEQLTDATSRGFSSDRVRRLWEVEALAPLRIRHDFRQLTSRLIPATGAQEGEDLKIVRLTAGKAGPQSMRPFDLDHWSNDRQLYWRGARPGDRLETEFLAEAAGTYDLEIVLTKAPDYGVVQLWLDDGKLGSPIDLFCATGVVTTGVLRHAGVPLQAGPHRLGLEIVGANPAARRGYMVGLDYLRLTLTLDSSDAATEPERGSAARRPPESSRSW